MRGAAFLTSLHSRLLIFYSIANVSSEDRVLYRILRRIVLLEISLQHLLATDLSVSLGDFSSTWGP